MMGEKLERIEKIGIKFLGREGKGGGLGRVVSQSNPKHTTH